MAGSDIVIGWQNSTAGISLVNLVGKGHFRPHVNAQQAAYLVPLFDPTPAWAVQSFSFCRPSFSDFESINPITATSKYIFAASHTAPADIDSLSSSFGYHDARYVFDIDSTTPTNYVVDGVQEDNAPAVPNTDNGVEYGTVLLVHGVSMFLAWVIAPFVGIFVARYLKAQLGHVWYIVHKIVMGVLVALVTVASVIFIALFYTPPHFSNGTLLGDTHVKVGLTILVLVVLQVLVGVVSNQLFDKERQTVLWWDRLHWWAGRLLTLLGVFNVYLGTNLYYSDVGVPLLVKLIYAGTLAIAVSAFLYGEIVIGAKIHVGYKEIPEQE
ncbi:hypothetical protein HDV06_000616 [Boothiomyces sp. JEL0866]|nr:hypothetical protein HDV06_000616 [Boothiomyces sp. JEL0866]